MNTSLIYYPQLICKIWSTSVCVITIYPYKNYVGLVLTGIIESVTCVIKEILETNFIIYLVVRFSLTQEEVCYPHVISNIQIVLFLRTFWTKKMNWNWRTHANLSLSYWSNFQVHSATNHVFVYFFPSIFDLNSLMIYHHVLLLCI